MTQEFDDMLDRLASLEHVQWMAWSKNIAQEEKLSEVRLARWQKLWVPYNELSDSDKEQDKVWARSVLASLREQRKAIRSKLVGVTFDNRQENIEKMRADTQLYWVHEPENVYDPNSIHVYADEAKTISIGHLKREIAEDLVPRLKAGASINITCTAVTGEGPQKTRGVNVKIDIGEK